MKRTLFVLASLLSFWAAAQHDTLWVKNGNVLYGEIKKLSFGVLILETDYSDSDFTIEFDQVERLSVERDCRITLTGGRRLYGHIRSEQPGYFTVTPEEGETEVFPLGTLSSIHR